MTAMAERLCRELAQLLAEHDGHAGDQAATGIARARLAVSLAEGLDGEVAGPRNRASAVDDPGELAAFLDQGLGEAEWNAVVDTLAHDATRRAEANSAAAFLDDIEGTCSPLPAGLETRAAETFAVEASAERGQRAGQGRWSTLWPALRGLRPGLVAVVLVAVVTPLALPLVWHARDASVHNTDSGPLERSLSPPGRGRGTPADRSTGAPAATPSCGPSANAAQGDRPAGDKDKAETGPAGGTKPEQRAAGQSPGMPVDDPCRSELGEGGRASTRPPPAGRN
jgi:hypothetical protein